MNELHIDYHPIRGCLHPELTFGEICVQCNECGRFDVNYICVNCGYSEGKKLFDKNWGEIEFYDVFSAPICPKCRPFFEKEDKTQVKESWNAKTIPCHIKDFKERKR